jgi:SAM-dependent methyltransferase
LTSQKERFLESEGNAWLARNEATLNARDWSRDPVVVKLNILGGRNARVLEIGCGDGSRLKHLADSGHRVKGLEPSARAVEHATALGIDATQGTADTLPFGDASFDIVIFGFCLYLCDDADLFRIASEADRVLADPGWLLVLDFDARSPSYRPYSHADGISSRKMDYKSMFSWHPAYTVASHEKYDHGTGLWTDDPNEWVSLVALRKKAPTR